MSAGANPLPARLAAAVMAAAVTRVIQVAIRVRAIVVVVAAADVAGAIELLGHPRVECDHPRKNQTDFSSRALRIVAYCKMPTETKIIAKPKTICHESASPPIQAPRPTAITGLR